jgi:hypothetical protein
LDGLDHFKSLSAFGLHLFEPFFVVFHIVVFSE